jgi:hypothetical protein
MLLIGIIVMAFSNNSKVFPFTTFVMLMAFPASPPQRDTPSPAPLLILEAETEEISYELCARIYNKKIRILRSFDGMAGEGYPWNASALDSGCRIRCVVLEKSMDRETFEKTIAFDIRIRYGDVCSSADDHCWRRDHRLSKIAFVFLWLMMIFARVNPFL